MTGKLRLLAEDGVSHRRGLAVDEVLALRTGDGRSPPTLRLYTYRSHAALVGRFQNAAHERAPSGCLPGPGRGGEPAANGGGAILMGEHQLGIALCVPGQGAGYGRARSLMAHFSKGVVQGLEAYGIQGVFARKNDLGVGGGRKIAGLGIHRTATGGLLFHCSLLVDLDIPFMLQVLNTPFEKISDKHIRSVSARITTVRRELGKPVALAGVREAVAGGFAAAFDAPCAALAEVDVDGIMVDVIGDRETIRDVYHLDHTPDDYEALLVRLERWGLPAIPHIILGHYFGRMQGEWAALEMVRRHPPKILVLVILMPLSGTPMAGVEPPSLKEIEQFFAQARRTLPTVPIQLGCAKPLGPIKNDIDRLAIDAGFNGIAYPSEGIVGYAREQGLKAQFINACCGVTWS